MNEQLTKVEEQTKDTKVIQEALQSDIEMKKKEKEFEIHSYHAQIKTKTLEKDNLMLK